MRTNEDTTPMCIMLKMMALPNNKILRLEDLK